MIKITLLATGLTLASSAALAGAPASPSEIRGYQHCLSAAQEEAPSFNVVKDYFINEGTEARTYYLNGFAAYDGAWTPVRVRCATTASGRRLMTMNLEPGRYQGVSVSATTTDIALN